ncbi:hypothetical protein RIF29_06522 [Crotalaria pallida]|uniref:Protein kinase domain-containing protein n=1 Tax=Crotalaria pallida TaxID=3830 RepID=A0AAN9J4E4_CROPI
MRFDLFQCCFTSTSSHTSAKDAIKLKWPIFPYSELCKATNDFDRCNYLGSGDLVTMYYGKLNNGCEIAIQCFHEEKRLTFQQFINETWILSYMPHQNLVSIYGHASDEEPMLVLEYISNGTLAARLGCDIAESSALPWHTRLDIAIDTANALSYLHRNGIIHCNVTSSNILLDKNFCAKVSNFLSSRPANAAHVANGIIGTCGYVDPKYMQYGRLSVKSDIYSFGVVLCELISSKLVRYREGDDGDSVGTLLSNKIKNQAWEELVDPKLGFQSDLTIKRMIIAVAELATRCLQCPQELRPDMTQVYISYDAMLLVTGKLQDGRKVAVKRFHEVTDKTIKHFMNEVGILSGLRHQNLILLYGCSPPDSNEHLIVYEYISHGALSKHLHGSFGSILPWLTRLNIAIDTATALVYLHDSGIIHRDVKPSNIILDENFTAKVGDFGLSRSFPDFLTHVSTIPVGTRAYIDPEYYQSGKVSVKSDVYSFGVVLFELISSKPPSVMEGKERVSLVHFAMDKILNKALEELLDPRLGFDSDDSNMEMVTAVAELAFQCVQCPKELRPSMNQVLETLEGIKKGIWLFNQIT